VLGCIALDRIRGADLDASPWRILAEVALVATAWACFAQVLGLLPSRWSATIWLFALLAAALLNVPAPLASAYWLEQTRPVAPVGAAVISTIWSITGSLLLVAAITSIGRSDSRHDRSRGAGRHRRGGAEGPVSWGRDRRGAAVEN
jgi:hypothetical protein